MRLGLPIIALLGGLLAAPASGAPRVRESLAILPVVVQGPRGGTSESDVYEAVTRATRARLGLRVISAEEMFVASREGLADRVADCGTDDGCIAAKLRMFDARFGLVVVLSYQLDPPIYSLKLLDTDLGRMVGERVGEVTPGEDPSARLEQQADVLLEAAGMVKSGRVIVEVQPHQTRLRLDNGSAPDPGSLNIFTLPPGRYTVTGDLEDHDPAEIAVDVTSGTTKTVPLTLEAQTSIWQSPWLWTAVGVVVVGATATAVAVSQRPNPCICTSMGGQRCICR